MPSLTDQEAEKYKRHLLIDGFTAEHQKKIKESKVLVIGGGGLGTPVLLYLTGAGVGTIGIVEFDQIDPSNLHRQILYSSEDIGKQKITVLEDKLSKLNPTCTFRSYSEKWSAENAFSIAEPFDILVDCTDNYESRYLSDKVSRKISIPMVYGAVYQMEGQVAVFNFQGSKSYSELFPQTNESMPHKEGGVLGPVAGTVASIQATEVLKMITGLGDVMVNKMLTLSLKYNRFQVVEY